MNQSQIMLKIANTHRTPQFCPSNSMLLIARKHSGVRVTASLLNQYERRYPPLLKGGHVQIPVLRVSIPERLTLKSLLTLLLTALRDPSANGQQCTGEKMARFEHLIRARKVELVMLDYMCWTAGGARGEAEILDWLTNLPRVHEIPMIFVAPRAFLNVANLHFRFQRAFAPPIELRS